MYIKTKTVFPILVFSVFCSILFGFYLSQKNVLEQTGITSLNQIDKFKELYVVLDNDMHVIEKIYRNISIVVHQDTNDVGYICVGPPAIQEYARAHYHFGKLNERE